MDYAVVLYFDEDTQRTISQIEKNICKLGVNTYMVDVGIRPHVTLSMFKDINEVMFAEWLSIYAGKCKPFDIKFSSIGVFPSVSSVLYMTPVMDEGLMIYHKHFHEQVKKAALSSDARYLPGNWVPHCTLATKLSQSELKQAMEVAANEFKPIVATVTKIGLAQCYPFREIVAFDMGKVFSHA